MTIGNILLIPDGNRRYARREHLATVLSDQGSLARLNLSEDVAVQLEERIRRFLQTGRDPFYDADMLDYLIEFDIGLDFLPAYKKGASNIDSVVRYILSDRLANAISIYGLQPANLQRRAEEIDAMLRAEIDQFNQWAQDVGLLADVKFKFVGDLSLLEKYPQGYLYQEAAKKLEESSKGQKLQIFILAPYDYRWEVNQEIRDGVFDESRLVVSLVDLVIRTSNERRISEALPIQSRNAEYVFRREYFPDFTLPVFREVIAEFYQRSRRFGR